MATLGPVTAGGDLEAGILRLPGVLGARVVTDADGRVIEVHVVADDAKHPKQIVRDVQTVALATAGVDIDRRVVSVVQMGSAAAGGPDAPAPVEATAAAPTKPERARIDGVSATQDGMRYRVEVALRHGDRRVTGAAEGPASSRSMLRVAAQATLAAVLQLASVPFGDVEAASLVRLGERDVAVVGIVLLGRSTEDVVIGAALLRGAGPNDAVARAVLDATNRRIAGGEA